VLYRYTQNNDHLDRYKFDAREITVVDRDDKGVWLKVARSVYNLEKDKPDKIEKWYWSFDSKVAVKK